MSTDNKDSTDFAKAAVMLGGDNSISTDNRDRKDFAKTAREELLMRVKHRDDWLKLQLLAQAVLWALANGVKFQAESPVPLTVVPTLVPAVSLAFCLLYYVEDGLIHLLSQYIGTLGTDSWDTSQQLRDYARGRILVFRAVAQLIAFVLVPWYLTLSRPLLSWGNLPLLFAIIIVAIGYKERRGTGQQEA
jgi:hypothetical protein